MSVCHSRYVLACAVILEVFSVGARAASVFNLPAGQTSLQMVVVGDPGNAADTRVDQLDGTSGYGAVGYPYQIGKYEVTAAQYATFLNSVATVSDLFSLYNPNMANPANSPSGPGCGITQNVVAGGFSYSVASGKENVPVNWVSWGDEARFSNWLSNGQPSSGVEDITTTENGSYSLLGTTTNAQLMLVNRNANSTYVIPSENEWYKAAFYKGGSTNAGYWLYETRSDTTPINTLSPSGTDNANFNSGVLSDPLNLLTTVGAFSSSPGPYGTFDQGGNVWESNEAKVSNLFRGLRGDRTARLSAIFAATSAAN